jgi:disulfide bond formation protein DsbB
VIYSIGLLIGPGLNVLRNFSMSLCIAIPIFVIQIMFGIIKPTKAILAIAIAATSFLSNSLSIFERFTEIVVYSGPDTAVFLVG